MIKSVFVNKLLSAAFLSVLLCSCANQIPPSGGEDDKIPPKIVSVFPEPGKLNYTKNYIRLVFDEYVDRRSFEESFYIYPLTAGNYKFDWSGKEVEIDFSENLKRNRTYVVTVGRNLKDSRGGNATSSPFTFAFSTGSSLDSGRISGKVFSEKYDKVKILLYMLSNEQEDINPEIEKADYVTQPDESGNYHFTNLPEGLFRIFALDDDDRNNLYSKLYDKIAVYSSDIKHDKINMSSENVNFLLTDPGLPAVENDLLKYLNPGIPGKLFTNIPAKDFIIPPGYKFYFYFKDNKFTKSEIVSNLIIVDSASGTPYNVIYNWMSDSLLEVFSSPEFLRSSVLKISLNIKGKEENIVFDSFVKTAGKENSGTVSGKLITGKIPEFPVYVYLINMKNKFVSFRKEIADTSEFIFENIPEGSYIILSFTDKNENGKFDWGNYFPLSFSEEFYMYAKPVEVKGKWKTDNIFIEY